MYVTLLLLAPAVCEWVEISQQHYRKPVHAHHFQTLDKVIEDVDKSANFHLHVRKPSGNTADMDKVIATFEETTSYRKQPFEISKETKQTENIKHFRRPFRTQADLGKATETYDETTSYRKPIRTQYFPTDIVTEVSVENSLTDKPVLYSEPTLPQHLTDMVKENYLEETVSEMYHLKPQTHFSKVNGVNDNNVEENWKRNRIYLNQSVSETNEWRKGNINKVSKYGNVQRVHLDNNVVKVPNLKKYPTRHSANTEKFNDKYKNKNDVRFLSGERDEIMTTEEISRDETFKTVERRNSNYVFNNKHTKNEDDFSIEDIDLKDTTDMNKVIKLATNKPKNDVTLETRGNYGTIRQKSPNSLFVTEGETIDFSDTTQNFDNLSRNKNGDTNSLTKPITHEERQKISERMEDKTLHNRPKKDNESVKPVIANLQNKAEIPSDSDYATVNDDGNESSVIYSDKMMSKESDKLSNNPSNSKPNTIENLMTLMKVVAETIRKNTKRSMNSKTMYLTNLKDTILRNIKERIDTTWPDDSIVAPRSRTVRAAQDSARGHLEVPSSESALMTISFLTFAVFLIKLVLQVIQKYKNKTMMMTPAIIATVGRAATKRRDTA